MSSNWKNTDTTSDASNSRNQPADFEDTAPDLSVIIVNYNTAEVTAKSITSVISNSGRLVVELIVVDNGSTDGSVEYLTAQFPQITVVDTGYNGGYAWGNNVGIHRSRGRYVLILNPDALVLDDTLERAVALLEKHPDIGLLGARAYLENGRQQLTVFRHPTLRNMAWNIFIPNRVIRKSSLFGDQRYASHSTDTALDVDIVAGCFMMISRKTLEIVGPMDHRFFMYSEESEWCWRVKQAGYRVHYNPEIQILHYGAVSTGQTSPWKSVEIARSHILFLRITRGVHVAYIGTMLMCIGDLLRIGIMLPAYFISREKQTCSTWKARLMFLLSALVSPPRGQTPPPPQEAGR